MPEPGTSDRPQVHPDDATMAAYVDGTLTPVEREQVGTHLLACDDCYVLLAEIARTEDELSDVRTDEVAARRPNATEVASLLDRWRESKRRTWAWTGGLVGVAAAVVFLVSNAAEPMAPLVAVVGPERLIVARPTGGFLYGPVRSPLRGASDPGTRNLALLEEAERLRARASRTSARNDVHAWGVAQLLTGDATGAVKTLDALRRSSPDVTAYHADLGAAALTSFLENGRDEDRALAIESLNRATAADPRLGEAWFNKGLLLEQLRLKEDAIDAWNSYLQLDSESPWSADARRHRDALREGAPDR